MSPRRALAAIAVVAGCGSTPAAPESGPVIAMRWDDASDLLAAPFPTEARADDAGRPTLAGFPTYDVDVIGKVVKLLERDARGFARSGGVFFRVERAPEGMKEGVLVDAPASVLPSAPIALLRVDAGRAQGVRHAFTATFHHDAGQYGGRDVLTVLPVQGLPLEPSALYVAAVLRGVAPLVRSAAVLGLLRGERPAGMSERAFDAHRAGLEALRAAGVAPDDVVALTAFRTGDPAAELRRVHAHATAQPVPAPSEPFKLLEKHPTYCAYETRIAMPMYQAGAAPYERDGGGFVWDARGEPVRQGAALGRFVATVPRAEMPAAGYPIALLTRTGLGGERPLVDRGAHPVRGGPPAEPGAGPARELARAGFAGASIDGPHTGLRNPTGADEQFLVYNLQNPEALRDNVRQSALELALATRILPAVAIDLTGCDGATAPSGRARFDAARMALVGHSMGATIAPIALAIEPRFGAAVLSGAGSSWIANVVHKKSPVDANTFAKVIFRMGASYTLGEDDLFLSLLEWAGEPAEPAVHGREAATARDILMLQGIVDTYILPPMANATTLSLGLDLAGEPLDAADPRLSSFTPLGTLLPLAGLGRVLLPASKNRDGRALLVTQHREDGVEDGHEIAFQSGVAKRDYACFLAGFASGIARLPARAAASERCD